MLQTHDATIRRARVDDYAQACRLSDAVDELAARSKGRHGCRTCSCVGGGRNRHAQIPDFGEVARFGVKVVPPRILLQTIGALR